MTLRRLRMMLVLAVALSATPAAAAAPPAPEFVSFVPEVTQGVTGTVGWEGVAFTPFSEQRGYELRVVDDSDGSQSVITTDSGETVARVALRDGHRYRLAVRATERPCATVLVDVCVASGAQAVPGPYSAVRTTRADATPPSGSVVVNAGAAFTRTRDVTLDLTYTDPPPGGPVRSLQISQTDSFPCAMPGPLLSTCPVAVAPTMPVTLAEGPDGIRTVRVAFLDDARPMEALMILEGFFGNTSPTYADTIVLDRRAPTAVARPSRIVVAAGAAVALSAAESADGAGGPADSGIDPASFRWETGDGRAAEGPDVTVSYPSPGDYVGTLRVADRAGNTGATSFRVTVTATGTGTSGVTGAPSATPVRFMRVVRLGRAVVGRPLRIRVVTSRRVRVSAVLLRMGAGGAGTAVRRGSVPAGPAGAVLRLPAAPAGAYVLRLTASGVTRRVPVRVARR